MGWILRIVMIAAAAITSLFVARDALNFGVVQMLVTIMLVVGLVLAAAAWSARPKT